MHHHWSYLHHIHTGLFLSPISSLYIFLNTVRSCHLRPVYSDTTQLNSTSSWVASLNTLGEGVYSDTTQFNSTDPVRQRTAKSVVFLFMTSRPTNWVNWVTTFIDRWHLFTLWTCRQLDVELSCIGVAIYTSPTQLNLTQLDVEFSWVVSL